VRRRISALLLSSALAAPMTAQTLDYNRFEGLFDEPVTMSATGKPERVSNSPVMMDIITADDIKRSGARDIPTLLQRLPGIDVYHGSPGTEELAMGGYIQIIGARVMVLLNGRQIYLGSFGSVFWSSLPVELDEIRQIEVVRGPQSALYGFNAVDGVINIITFDPAEESIDLVRGRVGNDARRDGSVSLTAGLGDGLGARLTAAGDHAHDEGALPSPLAPLQPDNPDRKVLSFSLSDHLKGGDRITFEAAHSDISQRSVPAGTAQFFNLRDKTDDVKADYVAETAMGRIGVSAALTLSDGPEASNGVLGAFRLHDHNSAAQIYDLVKLSPVDSLRIAFDGHNENMNITNFSSGTMSGRLLAGSAMWEHQFSPDLVLVNAVRYDNFHLARKGANLTGDIYTDADFDRAVHGTSINSSLLYRPDADDTLRLALSRGDSLPSLLSFGQLALFQPQYGGNYFYGNPNLQPSAVYEERLSWDRQLHTIDALLRLSAYHEQTMSVIVAPNEPVRSPPPPFCYPGSPLEAYACIPQRYENGPGTIANGAQLQLDHKAFDGLTWGLNYNFEWLNWHNRETPDADQKLHGLLPVHKVNANIGYASGDWSADLRFRYASETKGGIVAFDPMPTAVFQTVKNVSTLSPRLGWSPLKNMTLELVADNLWAYRDNLAERTPVTYYLSLLVHY